MLGEAPGAKLDDPLRVRLARAGAERERVREAVDRLAAAALQRRSARFMALVSAIGRQRRESGCDPVDLPSWAGLRDRAEELRGEASLEPQVRRAVDRVFDVDARAKAETGPVMAFLEAGEEHMRRREALEEQAGEAGVAPFALGDMKAWREGSRELRAAARRLLGEAEAGAAETRAASRLEDMPRLQDRVREALAGLEAVKLRDTGDAFMSLTDRVERLAVRDDTLALHADGYGRATMYAKELETLAALPEPARRRVGDWLARDRRWNEELASVAGLAGGFGQSADPGAQREAAGRPAIAEAIRRERERLLRVPEPAHWLRWTGEEPLVPGDRLRVGDGIMEIIVVSAGAAGGMHENDGLQVRMLDTAGPDEPPGLGAVIPRTAESLVGIGCARAAWSDEGLRALALARQQSVPSALCRLACGEPVPGDRIAWTEDAGEGRVRTVEAKVAARAGDIVYGSPRLRLETVEATGPDAPEPGSSIERTVAAVTARGCFRAEWSDEARRERILNPPKPVREPQQTQERTQGIDRSEGRSMGM